MLKRIELVSKLLRACTEVVLAETAFLEHPRNYASDDSLFMREAHFIVAVGLEGNPTMSELAQRLGVTQGAVSQIAKRLENKGYIIRTRNPQDRRSTMISLTESGKSLCTEHISYDLGRHQEISDFLVEFSDQELSRFIYLEEKLCEIFTNN